MNKSDGSNYLAIRVIIELNKTCDIMEDVLNRHFARFGLSQVKFNALMQLMYAGEEGLALSELGERMQVTKANITGLVDRLERDGLVYREADSRDRRSLRAKITPKARNLLQLVAPIHGEFAGKVLSALGPREKEVLIDLLKKLQSGLNKY